MTFPGVAIVGAGIAESPLGELLRDPDLKPHAFLDAAMEASRLVVGAAAEAWATAALDPDDGDSTECWLGTVYGTGHVSEYYVAALDSPRPLLNPRAFTFSCLNAVGGAVSSKLRLTGAAITLVGRNAGSDALAHACRSLALGRTRHAVCGAFDFPSPFASAALEQRGITVSPSRGAAAILVLTLAPAGQERGVPFEALVGEDDGRSSARGTDPDDAGVSPAVAPLLRLARCATQSRNNPRTSARPVGV